MRTQSPFLPVLLAVFACGIETSASKFRFVPRAATLHTADIITSDLQAFLDRPEDTLVLPSIPGGYITGPLKLRRDGVVLLMEPGVVLRAQAGAFPRTKDCLLTLDAVENVSISGYGARIVMSYPEYRTGEWRHCLNLRGSKRVRIQGLRIDSSGGDGIYIGSLKRAVRDASEDITIEDCILTGHRRQGISVVSVRRLLLANLRIEGTAGTAPECGIDFEPNHPGESLEDCVVRNCIFTGNANHAALVWLGKLKSASRPVSILFEACRFADSREGAGLQFSGFRHRGVRGEVRLRHCLLEGNAGQALVVLDKPADGPRLILDSCLIRHHPNHSQKGNRLPNAVFVMGLSEARWTIGGVRANGLEIETLDAVPIFQPSPGAETRFEDIRLEAFLAAGRNGLKQDMPDGVSWLPLDKPSMAARRVPKDSGGPGNGEEHDFPK